MWFNKILHFFFNIYIYIIQSTLCRRAAYKKVTPWKCWKYFDIVQIFIFDCAKTEIISILQYIYIYILDQHAAFITWNLLMHNHLMCKLKTIINNCPLIYLKEKHMKLLLSSSALKWILKTSYDLIFIYTWYHN